MKLLDAVNVDTDGQTFEVPPVGHNHLMDHAVFVYGTSMGGGQVVIQISPDGVNWFTARSPGAEAQVTFSSFDHMMVRLRGQFVRARLTGSTTASGVTVVLY